MEISTAFMSVMAKFIVNYVSIEKSRAVLPLPNRKNSVTFINDRGRRERKSVYSRHFYRDEHQIADNFIESATDILR